MVSQDTKILGLIGYPLKHSLSYVLHNFAFKHMNIPAIYINIPIPLENFQKAIEGLKYLPLYGLNVTIPYKELIIPYLDEISPLAQRVKAVNTITIKDGKWYGDNTDVLGFLKTLEDLNLPKDIPYFILGAGGAGRAIGFSICEYGAKEIYITNRTKEKGENLIKDLESYYPHVKIEFIPWGEKEYLSKYPFVIINTTSLGLDGESSPFKIESFLKGKIYFVYDIIYNPYKTPLILQAEKMKIPWKNGLDMLIYQGIYAWRNWFGIMPSFELLKKEGEKYLCDS
ncbi:MAG: shikimate dehydrogenase [Dictyoglomaceae bacterium]